MIPNNGADDGLWAELDGREAVDALSILSDRERDVLTMRVMDGRSTRTVTDALGISRVNVRVIQSRALVRIRAFAENNGGTLDKRFRLLTFPGIALAPEMLRRTLRAEHGGLVDGGRQGAGASTGASMTTQATVPSSLATNTSSLLSTLAPGSTPALAAAAIAVGTTVAAITPGLVATSSHPTTEPDWVPDATEVADPHASSVQNLAALSDPQPHASSKPPDARRSHRRRTPAQIPGRAMTNPD